MNLKAAICRLHFYESLHVLGKSFFCKIYKRASVGAGHAREQFDRGHGPLLQGSSVSLWVKRLCLCFLPLLLFTSAMNSAHATEFNQVQVNKSTLTFAYKQMGVPMEGKFRKLAAHIAFDPAKLSAAQAQIEVNPADIDTGLNDADTEVLGKLWFNARVFPSVRFVATGVKALGSNRYEALGKLTLKGKTQDVSAIFTFKPEGAAGVFDGAFTLKRLDYAIGEGEWTDVSAVANEVQVKFHIVANAVK